MERLIVSAEDGLSARLRAKLSQCLEQIAWEAGRGRRALTRRFGIVGWLSPLCLIIALLAWWAQYAQIEQLSQVRVRMAKQKIAQAEHGVGGGQSIDALKGMDGRARLQAFADYLLPHQDIPVAVEGILSLAEKDGLSIQRGEYRPQVESAGAFLRYHMTFPVRGPARAIHHFMQAVLLLQKNLALENVQFRRERIDSPDIEARIQWVLFANLPGNGVMQIEAGNADSEAKQ